MNQAKEISANYELTPEELAEAVEAAKLAKHYRLEKEEKEKRRQEAEDELRKPWTSGQLFEYVELRAVNDFGFQFVVDSANEHVVKALARYFTNDEKFLKMGEGFSLNKGLLLHGNVGTGKSTLMQLFSRNKTQCYNMVSCRTVSAKYAQDGDAIFSFFRGPNFYTKDDPRVFFQKEVGLCFDDLGTEEVKKHYGNEENVMSTILLNRYDEKYRYSFRQTHITTNLNAAEIEQLYGTRVKSRLREMFNIISLDGDDRRK